MHVLGTSFSYNSLKINELGDRQFQSTVWRLSQQVLNDEKVTMRILIGDRISFISCPGAKDNFSFQSSRFFIKLNVFQINYNLRKTFDSAGISSNLMV